MCSFSLVSSCIRLCDFIFLHFNTRFYLERERGRKNKVLKKVNGRNGEKKEEKERNMRSAVVFAISVRLR